MTPPTSAISSTVDAIIETLNDEKLSRPDKSVERRQRIRSLIRNRFDFEEMAKRSLARHWGQRSESEKEEFVSLFSELLEASYIGKIESYTDEKVTYDKEEIKGDGRYAVVDTSIVTKTVTIPIEYKVILKDDKWWVYDVLIEGVSFISTYRSQYNTMIVKKSYPYLVQQMKEKIADLESRPEGAAAKKP